MKSERRILLTDVNQYITCVLCKGYLIDATTITECLHTFCKKCIVEYLEENTNCPICDTLLHQSHPLLYIAHDRTLQSIVYKLVANLEIDEIERQCKYYRENNLEFPAQLKEKIELMNKKNGSNSKLINSEENKNEQTSTTSKVSDESSSIHKENNYHRDDEPIALRLEPLEGLQELKNKYVICSCHSTITHVKKYIALKLYSNIEQYKELDILCDDEILGKDHSLKFILVTKWKNQEQPLKLNFRPKLIF